jgi:hypothetical protein
MSCGTSNSNINNNWCPIFEISNINTNKAVSLCFKNSWFVFNGNARMNSL